MSRARVLLAGGHAGVVAALYRLLETEVDLVGVAEDGRALLQANADLVPDIIVTDILLPLLNGLEVTRQLKTEDPNVKVVLVAPHPGADLAKQAFQAGACGYVLKQRAAEDLAPAIREVHQGRSYLSPQIARDVLRALVESVPDPQVTVRLTSRQREVLQLVAEGKSTAEAAAILGLSSRTIEFHRYRVMKKLDLHSTVELTRYAIKHGFVFLDD